MKKMNLKNALMAFAVMLVFLLLGAGRAEAQASPFVDGNAAGVPGLTYVTATEAENILTNAVQDQKLIMESFQPGHPLYDASYRLYLYYTGIITELYGGKNVPMAINDGLFHLNDSNGNGNLTQPQYAQLRQNATDLLTK